MNRLALCLPLLATLAGCEPTTPEQAAKQKLSQPFADVFVHQDDARGVTCWAPRDSRAGLSCLPDWMLNVHINEHQPAQRSRMHTLIF